jgi:glutamyl-tRNA synthetase
MTVRTRYAPSPTGIPHIGNLRTGLFAWALARRHGGQFLLRIEDTDRARMVEGAVEKIIESLKALGLDYDEGPGRGGPHTPYVQSERLDLYQREAARLIEQGDAYECWCSPQRLDEVRAEQQRLKEPPRYDRRCRTEVGRHAAREEAGADARPVVRFATPLEGSVTVDDVIRGATTFDVATLDDFVLLKSDGYPTYHLAHIVDDHEMEITHILRGDEWIPSAPRHVLVWKALGWEMPALAHLPLILGPDGSKLSKRHGATTVFEYLDQGYLPDAIFNFVCMLGWSLDDKTDILSRAQFVEHFSLERVVKNPAVFNMEKLTWMNGVYIREMDEVRLADIFAERLERDLPPSVPRPIDRSVVRAVTPLIRERVKVLSEVVEYCDFFFEEEIKYGQSDLLGKAYRDRPGDAAKALGAARERVEGADWTHEGLESQLRGLAESMGVKPGDLFGLVRVAVTGKRVSPPLFETMEILGRERCLARLEQAEGMLR